MIALLTIVAIVTIGLGLGIADERYHITRDRRLEALFYLGVIGWLLAINGWTLLNGWTVLS